MTTLSQSIMDLGMIDVDSHEMTPSSSWAEIFGDVGADMALLDKGILGEATEENTIIRQNAVTDTAEITDENVWHVKGPEALEPSTCAGARMCSTPWASSGSSCSRPSA